jgi:type II secretory pathway component PulF
MKAFLYKAKNNRGQIVTGTVKAENEMLAEKLLMSHNFAVLDLVAQKSEGMNMNSLFETRVSSRDKALFARQLSTMISAGLELSRAIKVVSTQARNDKVRSVYLNIYKDIEEGLSFSGALAKHPREFDPIFISVINAGEATGKLDVVLNQLAEQLESDNNFSGKVKGALYYPAFILVALVGIGIYMMVAVIPTLKGVFASAGAQLPIATRILIGMSDFFVKFWWLVLLIAIGLGSFIYYWLRSKTGGEFKDMLQIKTPGFKKLYGGMYMYRFTTVLSMLIGAGVPLLDALKIGGTTLNNGVYEESVARIISQVEKGVPLSVQLSKETIFPALVGQMAAVGEETGQIDKVLDKVADYYGEQTDEMIKTISTLVEPIVIVIMGLGVAFLVFAILVPIYNVSQLG